MLYRNDSQAALAACERERTGNYGYDEYRNLYTIDDIDDYDDEGDWKDAEWDR